MMEVMALMFWLGGYLVAHDSLRAEGCGRWSAFWNAVFWPFVLGAVAARWADRNNSAPKE